MSVGVGVSDAFSYLTTPPESCGRSPIVTRPQILPLDSLEPKDFERLCYRLARLDSDVEECRLYGVHGQAQQGIDLYARLRDGTYRTIQCKRSSDGFAPGEVTDAVDTFLKGGWAASSDQFVLAVTADLSRTQVLEQIKTERAKLARRNISFEVWDELHLSTVLKEHDRLVDDFFGRDAVRVFLGEDAARRLGARLDACDVIAYREKLGALYGSVFRSLERGVHGDERNVALDSRFVMPDVYVADPVDSTALEQSSVQDDGPSIVEADLDPDMRAIVVPDRRRTLGPAFRPRVNGVDWLAAGVQHLVVGAPGTGKSALLRMLVLEALSPAPRSLGSLERFQGALPLWLPFAFWTNAARDDRRAQSVLGAVRRWLDTYDSLDLWPLVEKALGDDRLVLVVDGLDEWASPGLARVCLHRLDVFASTKHADVVASTRPFSSVELPLDASRWRRATLAPLSEAQQLEFIARWLAPLVDEAQVEVESARWAGEVGSAPHLSALADVPLFLTLLLRARDQRAEFPEDLHAVLDTAVDRMIGEHRRRKIELSGAQDAFPSTPHIRTVCRVTAEHMHTRSVVTLGDEDLRRVFRDTLGNAIGYPQSEAHAAAIAMVDGLSPGIGVMIRPAPDESQFFHRLVLEFLAAERMLEREPQEQRELLCRYLTDRRWGQVLRFLVRGLNRPREIAAVFEALESAEVASPRLREATDLLAADVAVGSGAVDPPTRRRLLERVVREIETGERDGHRAQLVAHVVPGLSRKELAADLDARVRGWMAAPSTGEWARVLRVAASWEPDDVLADVLWHGLHAGDATVQRAAAQAFGQAFPAHDRHGERVLGLAVESQLEQRRAAAIEALSLSNPIHPGLPELIGVCREHHDFAVRHAAVAADLRRGNASERNRDLLIGLLEEASRAPHWPGGLITLATTHFPDDQIIFDAFVTQLTSDVAESMRARGPATLLLTGYATRPRVREHFLRFIERSPEGSPESAYLVAGEIPWARIATAYRQDREVVAAVETLIDELTRSSITDSAIHGCSLVARTDRVRDTLIERLGGTHNGWAIRALNEGWRDDATARRALTALLEGPRRSSDGVVAHMTELVLDPGQALELLLSLPHADVNPTALVRSLADAVRLGAGVGDPRVSDAVERALDADSPSPWDRPEIPIFECFPRVPGVRERALRRLDDRDAPLASIAYGFGHDAPVREALAMRLRPLDVALRGRLVAGIAELPTSNETAGAVLARYDVEPHPGIKIAAATAHARRAKESGNVDDALVRGFVDQAHALGPDLDDRRAAAFCALAELGRLDLLAQRTEPLGEPRPLRLGGPVFGGKPEFYRALCRHWEHVESALGRDFPRRFGYGDGESVEFLENVLAVAHDYPNTHQDLAAVLERLPQLRATGSGIRYMWRTDAPRDRLWHCVSTVIEDGHALSYVEARPIMTALRVLTEAFHDDPRTDAWLDTIAANIERRHRNAAGQWHPKVLGYGATAALARLRPQDRLVETLLAETQPVQGRPWYYFHQWSELVLAGASDAHAFVDGATRLAEIVRLNFDFADYLHEPVAARLRRAPELAVEVAALVPELSGPAWGIALRGLALSGHLDGELQEHLRRLVERPEQHLTTLDPLTATVRSARLLALEILDSTEQATPVW